MGTHNDLIMQRKLAIVFSFLGIISGISAQFLQNGQCDPDISLQANFDVDLFTDVWYEIGVSESDAGVCSTWNVSRTDGTNFVFAYSSVLSDIRQNQNIQASYETGSAKFTLSNYGENGNNADFWILGTNHQNYAIVYRCENVGTTQRNVYITLMGKEPTIDSLFNFIINNILGTVGVSLTDLVNIDHSEEACFALPSIPPGEAIILPGQCNPNISLLTSFNAAEFVGTWYEIYSYYSENALGTCARAEYSLGEGVVNVLNSQVVNQTLDTISGTASVVDTAPGMLLVVLEVLPEVFVESYLWVIDTNYVDYAITYSCNNLPDNTKRVTSWIVSRSPQLSEAGRTAVNRVVDSVLDLNFAYYQQSDQSADACFYYPEPSPDTVVVFRGECDLNIPVVTGFDPTRYTGLWHDIESYPTPFQNGQCNNARYTLVDGVVDVFNTQVINQTLDTIVGEARLVASNDGSAKLAVTFPVDGNPSITIETSYWVLATDYDSYSLVYSCEYNSLTDTRQVFSWKLSRTRSLSNAANTAMNAIIASIPVLDQDYFFERDQSPEACFYFPEPEEGVPVVFPGVCDQNITTVQNFDLLSFQGSWFEIETYPKEESGECVQHQYSAGTGNALNLVSTFVQDQFRYSSSSVLTQTSTDNSGKFNIRINVGNNQEIEIPFWILATDYSSYALAYSCMEREADDDFRAVNVWKLSRNQQGLSAAANTAINSVIVNVDVLDQRYFETVDQTEAGCVSLPDIDAGQPIILDGQCDPNIQVKQNFSAGDYLGTWYLVESYWSEFQNGDCNDATYSLLNDGSVLVFNTQVINQTLDTITGNAVVIGTDGSAKLSVTFPDAPFPVEYWVIDTDYTSYALVYSCINLSGNTQQIWSWKMSRTRSLSAAAINSINQAISNVFVLNNRFYYTIDNSDEACFYFPEPNGQPVAFRGQCDDSIQVVTNFDAVAYMGLWYDIQSYPQDFQDGTCATAFYTLTDVVEVFNTQVINQRLDTITGSAVPLESVDGQAKLNVTFPIEVAPGVFVDTFSPYWVLATDYTDYALVYACQNTGEDQRLVSSWKLSRTKSLSTQAQTAINNVIQSIDVLRQEYYEEKGHSDEQCFYYPEPTGEPVVFRGQCDDSIQAFPNFNLQSFAGEWNEIETYPKDQVGGQCIHHSFTASATSDTSLLLTSNQVFNSETLVSNSGNIELNSTDGSGRFVLTIAVNGTQEISIPYWIIDTDYTDYALVYSCMNRDEETRAVYSWKLSRSKQLSIGATNSIATAMNSVDVLDEQYFEQVDHSVDACFYLPDTGSNEPVIFPGQCDPNIPVVQNFNAGDYLGRWHLIETYYSEFQNGDCNDATYSLQNDGSVLVFNTQVINQTLDTIIGNAVVISTDGSAKLSVTFPDAPFPIEYWVVDTDYTSYALIYSCFNLDNNRQQVWSWKMSRTRSLTIEAVNRIEQAISDIRVLDNRYYGVVDNTDEACFYFPEPNGQPVVFRGQCDDSIQVVTNFDAVAYMGLWYDIQSYPQDFQDGTCATAFYTLADVVEVFNTQVINQRLDTITGSAVPLESVDGQAKLNVTFPIEVAPGVFVDTFSPYWVLATDYTDYALVYSCQNIGDDERLVSSWQLSRTKSLSTQAQTAINNEIQRVDVLRQDYYEVKGHTDEDCFYFPVPNGEPVVFRGQCDNNIQAIPNFDAERFIGTWNEIETYPKEQAGGQCIHHEFSAGSTTNAAFDLISNQVFGETLVSNAGQLVLDSTDGTGRFLLTMDVGNQSITIPYWIIDTDYTDYALVYSCMNRDSETRAVYSWKLSKSAELSTSANAAINAAVANIDVLDQQYFEPVSQTAEDCFYLPDVINPNEPAIFTGQCDTTISVKENFDATRFAGRWFDIESYFDGYNGTCIDGTFTLNNNGYDVILTQVVDQALDVTSSTAVVNNEAKLIVSSNGVVYEYWILDTDYESWALIYSCQNVDASQRRVRSWKMSRTRALSPEANTAINVFINNINVLNQQFFLTRDHSDAACFYYPVPDGNPVTFRGRCDQTIPVVQNFDVAAYLGQWYDIESYPQSFQEGECSAALYTLGPDGVLVYNTQVVNQQLDEMNGLAVVASTDGSAKLSVTFEIDGFTLETPYWVLSTDYNTYSFVYSCSEVDDEYKRVSAWKLSRTRNLTEAANQEINQVMSTIPVLQQEYFRQIQHGEEDCFFYPDNNGGPVILDGQCPNSNEVDVVEGFNLNSFTGTWHEIARFPSNEQTGECASADYAVSMQNTINMSQNIVNNERLVVASGSGTVGNDGRGVISASLAGDQFAADFNLYVLDTDYTEFALLYACQNVNDNQKQIYSWKLSRSRAGLSQAANDRINAIVSENVDLFELYYETTEQTDAACFYYPEFDELPNVIELPGPCNDTIRGVPGFDAGAYLGRWFEMARYPQPFQFGACDQATYSLGNDVVDVYNTQVVNRTLLIQEGFAEVASTDGSGQLQVTFDVNGVTNIANYYIMATDYTSYALVYSCRNLDNGNREVSSWKLSRDRTLSNAANQAMDAVIASTQGLLQDYYVSTSQADEDCFYIPEPNPEEYVVFRGQCGDVSGMANFNVQSYLGLWHEIERYPTGQNDGVCISAAFSSSGSQFQVVDTNVFDLSATITTGTVTITNDGRITRNTGQSSTDIWVLATDYTSYALLYSCENIDSEYRRVWSAKHSRTRSLTAAAETAIENAMTSNDLLHDEHFVPVDQSEDACFYYPEVTGEPVVLPGLCDPNIPVQQNFVLEEYSGNWFQIERYPQTWETGNCTGARYTINGDVVDVRNWQVIDGELDIIDGTATVISDDNSGKVRVELPSRAEGAEEGDTVQMDLYVLKTDYVSYSLVYSCVNINEYQRQLGVWKLSRSRVLPSAANTEINTYMATRQELDQQYFVEVGQDDDCPSSSYLVQSSIILLLVCSILQLFK